MNQAGLLPARDAPGALLRAPHGQREPLAGTTLVAHLDDALLDLDRPVRVEVNRAEAFSGKVTSSAAVIAETTARSGDPGRVFTARVEIPLPAAAP